MSRTLLLGLALVTSAAMPSFAAEPDAQALQRRANGEFLFKNYPPRALAAGEQGSVGFRLSLDRKGAITDCNVTQSSGHAGLDRETCELLASYAKFDPVRDSDGNGIKAVYNGTVAWRLPDAATVAARTSGTAMAARADDKVVCKRTRITGSLVATSKSCKTQRQWDRDSQRVKQEMEGLQGIKGAKQGT